MSYIFIALILCCFIYLLSNIFHNRKIVKKRNALIAKWGKLKTEYPHIHLVDGYWRNTANPAFHQLSEQTKTDIDFNDLFAYIDRTVSKVGQQFLYDQLNKPLGDVESLREFDRKVKFFIENVEERQKVQAILLKLDSNDAYYIANLLNGTILERPKWFPVLYLLSGSLLLVTILSLYKPVFIIGVMALFACSLGVHFWNKNQTFMFSRSLPQLKILMQVARLLNKEPIPFEGSKVSACLEQLKTYKHKMVLISFGVSVIKDEMALLFRYLVDMTKAFFLIEVYSLYSITSELKNKQEAVNLLFRYVGEIDACLSVASLRSASNTTCQPEFVNRDKRMSITGAYHPLIENCIPNDLEVRDSSILITGSNMSGKTTFLRTVAQNAILAQTIYTCFAQAFKAPITKVCTSIRMDDSLLDGKSYYLQEVSLMHSLIRAAESDDHHLFLLDEVFKGTNTVERISAAKAVLSDLNKGNNLVFVSTHDIELAGLLGNEYTLYHFSETVAENQLHFDHRIKAGVLTTRNAIAILEIMNFPSRIVEEARELSNKIKMHSIIPCQNAMN